MNSDTDRMKRLTAIAAAALLIASPAVAQSDRTDTPPGTWIFQGTMPINDPSQNNDCASYGFCKIAYLVDVASIVKRGDINYFNVWMQMRNAKGNVVPPPSSRPHAIDGYQVNCQNKRIKGPGFNWKPYTFNPSKAIGEFICNN